MIKTLICSTITIAVIKNDGSCLPIALLNVLIYVALLEIEELFKEWRRRHGITR